MKWSDDNDGGAVSISRFIHTRIYIRVFFCCCSTYIEMSIQMCIGKWFFFADSPFVAAAVAAVSVVAVAAFFLFFFFSYFMLVPFLWLLVRKFLQIIPNWWNRHCNYVSVYVCAYVEYVFFSSLLLAIAWNTTLIRQKKSHTLNEFFSAFNWPTFFFLRLF